MYTVQVPHHGSPTGYNPQFWKKVKTAGNNSVGIISHAKSSRSHPNKKVLIDLMAYISRHSVTEDPISQYSQKIKLYNLHGSNLGTNS